MTSNNVAGNYEPGAENYSLDIGSQDFSQHHKNKPFKEITHDYIINYLNSLRKPEERDQMHEWMILLFKDVLLVVCLTKLSLLFQ